LARRSKRHNTDANPFPGVRIKFSYAPSDIKMLTQTLEHLEPNIRKKVVRIALHSWAQKVKKTMKRGAYRKAIHTKAAIVAKVKVYRNAIWAGVGVLTGKLTKGQTKGRYGDFAPGWRAHFYDGGWRAYAKGLPSTHLGKGRDWRKGVRGTLGPVRYATGFIRRAYAEHAGTMRQEVNYGLATYLKRMQTKAKRAT
jgi:hypothetical protein